MAAILCNEPFWLTPQQIAQLTPLQVRELYLCDRDADGRVMVSGSGEPKPLPTNRDLFYAHWRYQGLREDQIDRLWDEREVIEETE